MSRPTTWTFARSSGWKASSTDFPARFWWFRDRRLLESVSRTVWDVEAGGVTVYTGGFTAYREKRAAAACASRKSTSGSRPR